VHPAWEKLSGGMLAWLCVWVVVDLHMAQLMPLPLAVSFSTKLRLVLPSWFYLFGTGMQVYMINMKAQYT